MRRKDREITDFQTILEMIDQCEILRLGLLDGDFPYIVPVNFAYQWEREVLSFYIHGAMAGRKYELMQKNQNCSFEMDRPLKMEALPEQKDVTMRYECVMGTADIEFLEGEEKQRAIDDIIMNRYEVTRNFEYNQNTVIRTAVAKLTVTSITAKRNPLLGGAD